MAAGHPQELPLQKYSILVLNPVEILFGEGEGVKPRDIAL